MLRPAKVESVNRKLASAAVLADEQLVVRCLRNERTAWAELFELCHSRIVTRVCSVLRRAPGTLDAAEEVAAKVWLAVVVDEGRLLRRFDAGNGTRVATYLSGIAGKETLKFLRSSRRRKHREAEYGKAAARRTSTTPVALLELKEFLSLLTPAEHHVCLSDLKATNKPSAERNKNFAATRRSVRSKLADFLRSERGAR